MKIYTRRGDTGITGLYRGAAIGKDAARIDALGDVDELNSVLGWVLAQKPAEPFVPMLKWIQDDLFHVGAELASLDPETAGTAQISSQDIGRLEQQIDQLDAALPPLESFILPGGGVCGAAFHLARATARRAERAVVRLSSEIGARGSETGNSLGEMNKSGGLPANKVEPPIRPELIAYLNRLNDLLFVMARSQNSVDGASETRWAAADRLERHSPSENE